jgi:hypothetical protein
VTTRFQKGHKKKGGRKKGMTNKVTGAVKEVIAQVATELGGAERMLEWVKEDPQNERIFWSQIYPKLLPLQVAGHDGGPIEVRWKEPGEVL